MWHLFRSSYTDGGYGVMNLFTQMMQGDKTEEGNGGFQQEVDTVNNHRPYPPLPPITPLADPYPQTDQPGHCIVASGKSFHRRSPRHRGRPGGYPRNFCHTVWYDHAGYLRKRLQQKRLHWLQQHRRPHRWRRHKRSYMPYQHGRSIQLLLATQC